MRWSHPIVVITGASSGIGAACVRQFGSADFRTVGVDIGQRSEADEHFVVDLATPTCAGYVMKGVGDRPVRVLVNNAAVDSDISIMETTPEIWDRTLAINLRAPFLLSRGAPPGIGRRGRGGDRQRVECSRIGDLTRRRRLYRSQRWADLVDQGDGR